MLINIWGLILIDLGLFFGCCSRIASIAGILLLLLYYVANPPLIGISAGMATEGNYLVVDKNLVELIALIVLTFFPTGQLLGLDRLIMAWRNKMAAPGMTARPLKQDTDEKPEPVPSLNRRELLKSLASTPVFGAFIFTFLKKRGWESYEEKFLVEAQKNDLDAITSPTLKTFQYASLKDLTGQVPNGQIGNLKVSRLILGGNLIGGWAHARDLLYVSKLVKTYNTDDKVIETLRLAENCGVF